MGENPKQVKFDLEPEYAISETGTKHEFNGLILVPTPEEMTRLGVKEEKQKTEEQTLCHFEKNPNRPRTKVNMNPLEALRLRARGQ